MFEKRQRYSVWVLAAFVLITFFVNNHVLVPDIMESRNIITAREMVYDGNWVVTTMNGDFRFEKPPLPTWLTAFAEIISPDSLFLQRAMAGLAAVMLVFFFYRFAARVIKTDPIMSTLVLCTCYNVVLMGRTASWDIYCHAFMMGAIYFIAEAMMLNGAQWRRWLLAGVMIGLSIMSKGPVSLYGLLLSFLIAYTIVYRPRMAGKWRAAGVMTLVALAIGSWWYVYIHLTHGEALAHVAGKESGAWFNHNVRPWYYYWTFFLETGIWSVAMLTVLAYAIVTGWKGMSAAVKISLLWLLVALVLLSLLPEKKNRYLLPILMPAALSIAAMFTEWMKAFAQGKATRFVRVAYVINGWCLIVAGVVVAGVSVYICGKGML
ncbi:MAG: glycosyltransferase family 39 protein [Muribaculum sp.]|nr:glycosyltransferase family 39 protein [Muribaculaceae bacterium]MCM1081166.1 glycosyltransferase family 39 protein [Muribaculum sp.]